MHCGSLWNRLLIRGKLLARVRATDIVVVFPESDIGALAVGSVGGNCASAFLDLKQSVCHGIFVRSSLHLIDCSDFSRGVPRIL